MAWLLPPLAATRGLVAPCPAQPAHFADAERVQQVFGWLSRRNFFIDSRAGARADDAVIYRYHDLFRDFLLERGRQAFSPAERRALLQRAAAAANEAAQPEIALSLAVEAECWDEAGRLICTLAPKMVREGRGTALDQWINSLPAQLVSTTPWLLYWQGNAQLPLAPARARHFLQAAFMQFEAAGNRLACVLSCAGTFQSFFLEWGDQHALDPWVERFRVLIGTPGLEIPREIEIPVIASLVGVFLRFGGDPLLKHFFERSLRLLETSNELAEQVPLAFYGVVYCQMIGKWAEGLPLLAHLEKIVEADVAPLLRLSCANLMITWRSMCADYASESEGRREIQRFIELSDSSGIHSLDVLGLGQGIYFAINWQDPRFAEQLLERLPRLISPQRIMDHAHCTLLRALVALGRGDAAHAGALATKSMEQAIACGARFGLCQNQCLSAQIQLMYGDGPAALREADSALALARDIGTLCFEFTALLIKAWVLLRTGAEPEGLQVLREALALGRSTSQSVPTPAAPSRLRSYLFAVALQHGIEADYVRGLIRIYRLRPPTADLAPAPDLSNWPWPLRIHTLGRFGLARHNVPLRMSGKVQKKPLHVLQALIALGGRSVAVDTLIRHVWPARGSSARVSFNVALVRLRRLLGNPETLLLSAGKLTLNEHLCWVDTWAFELAASAAEHADPARRAEATAMALRLYQGSFLHDDDVLACVTLARERLATRFRRLALRAGRELEDAGDYDRAVEIYRLGLARDELSEELHRRLIHGEWKRGNHAEAVQAYQRCREVLARRLRMRPGAETERLYRMVVAE